MRLNWLLALMVLLADGSHTTMSASEPAASRPFFWIDIEDAGDIRGSHRDDLLLCQPAGIDRSGPEQWHAVFETAGAVRDLAKIVDAKSLLLRGERAVVGRDH